MTYKANTNDVRESPALEIFRQLRLVHGEKVIAIDPLVDEDPINGIYAAVPEHQVHRKNTFSAILVAHEQFENIVWDTKRLFDCCGLLERS